MDTGAPTPDTRRALRRAGRLVTDPAAWTGAALVTSLLVGADEGASRGWWLLPLLLASQLLLWHTRHRRPLVRGPWPAVVTYVTGGLVGGVVYELSLDAGGGIGGLDADAGTSFLLLPGYLVPAVGFTLWATRRFGLDARRQYFLAGCMSWYEAITVGGLALVSQPLLAPLLVAFYVASYAVYNGALGMLVVDPTALHAPAPAHLTWPRLLALSVLGGGLAWAIYVGWAAVVT